MANIISKLLDQQLLLAIGLLLAILPQATIIPEVIRTPLAGLASIGALLVVVAAILILYAKFKR